MKPNVQIDTTIDQGMDLRDVKVAIGEIWGVEIVVFCWDAPIEIAALQMAPPSIQIISLAHNPAFYELLKQFAARKGVSCNLRRDPGLSLPAVVKLLTGGKVDIRKHGTQSMRFELVDALWVARIARWSQIPL